MYFSSEYLIMVCFFLWFFSFLGLFFSKNFILILISFELMFLSVCVLFNLFSFDNGSYYGVIFSLYILGIVAAESAIGLALYIIFYKSLK